MKKLKSWAVLRPDGFNTTVEQWHGSVGFRAPDVQARFVSHESARRALLNAGYARPQCNGDYWERGE